MLAMGAAKPDSTIAGTTERNVPEIAPDCVRAIEDINRPMPTVESSMAASDRARRANEPRNGASNHRIMSAVSAMP
jgi:hypothetical protein